MTADDAARTMTQGRSELAYRTPLTYALLILHQHEPDWLHPAVYAYLANGSQTPPPGSAPSHAVPGGGQTPEGEEGSSALSLPSADASPTGPRPPAPTPADVFGVVRDVLTAHGDSPTYAGLVAAKVRDRLTDEETP